MKSSIVKKSCFLDTSFLINALVNNNEKVSALFAEMISEKTLVYTNIIVISEYLNFLERTYFQKDHAETKQLSLREKNKIFKLWRKEQKGSYKTVIAEFRAAFNLLKDTYNIEFIPLGKIDNDFHPMLDAKIKFSPLDANDCIHYLSAKNHTKQIDLLVNSDNDFKIIDSEKCLPNNLTIF